MKHILILVENKKSMDNVVNQLRRNFNRNDLISVHVSSDNAVFKTKVNKYIIELKNESIKDSYFDQIIDLTFDGIMNRLIEKEIENELNGVSGYVTDSTED